MNLFDQLVTNALKHQPNLASLRMVVEKELLHHDILRTLSQNNLLSELTFIGGTCLRVCYGGVRLSEDLDFTGGRQFSRESLSQMGEVLIESLQRKYGLQVKVSHPVKEINNVDTWKIKVETRPAQKHLPSQRINIDICKIPSYERQPMVLLNPYGVDMGTNGLILQAQSLEEIYIDKLLAFALRPNRIKYRDLWDILWLHQKGLQPRYSLTSQKLEDHQCSREYFVNALEAREKLLCTDALLSVEFRKEMQRFLSVKQVHEIINQGDLWEFIKYLISDLSTQLKQVL